METLEYNYEAPTSVPALPWESSCNFYFSFEMASLPSVSLPSSNLRGAAPWYIMLNHRSWQLLTNEGGKNPALASGRERKKSFCQKSDAECVIFGVSIYDISVDSAFSRLSGSLSKSFETVRRIILTVPKLKRNILLIFQRDTKVLMSNYEGVLESNANLEIKLFYLQRSFTGLSYFST